MKWTLNQMVESSKGRMQYRAPQVLMLLSSSLLLWLTLERTPHFKANHKKISSLFSLEQRVSGLRLTVTDSALNQARFEAENGVFLNWKEIAQWLEYLRAKAIENELSLTHSIENKALKFDEIDGIELFPLVLKISNEEKKYSHLIRYLRDNVYNSGYYLDTKYFHITADSTGINEMELSINGWLLQ